MLDFRKAVVAMIGAGTMLMATACHKQATQSAELGNSGHGWPLQPIQNLPADRLNSAPLVVDRAMQMRDWGRSTSFYENGNTIAGPVGFKYEAAWGQPEPLYAVEEPAFFVGQSVLLPITRLIIEPGWNKHRYTGVTIPPSYTAMPEVPMPPNSTASAPNGSTATR